MISNFRWKLKYLLINKERLIVFFFSFFTFKFPHASPSPLRWGREWSLVPSAARCGSSAQPVETLGRTSCGWRTTGRWRSRRLARVARRSGRWAWRTWCRSTAGGTPAGCPTAPGRSTPRTKLKSYVSVSHNKHLETQRVNRGDYGCLCASCFMLFRSRPQEKKNSLINLIVGLGSTEEEVKRSLWSVSPPRLIVISGTYS